MVQKLSALTSGKRVIGLTGSFGSGKSTVAQWFETWGAKVLDADKIAHEALAAGSPLGKKIEQIFGPAVLNEDGSVNRKALAAVVFQDAGKRKELEALIHPFVFQRFRDEIKKATESVVVLDVPLLFETQFNVQCDRTVVVNAPSGIIEQRLAQKGFSKEEVRARTLSQFPLSQKVRLADCVISNEGSLDATREQAAAVWKSLTGECK